MAISISPSTLDFGCIAAGYVYTLDALIVNSTPMTQRVKLNMATENIGANKVNLICRPVQFASGMSLPCKIEFTAEEPSSSNRYQVKVVSDHGLEVASFITAFVLPMDTFKYFAKSLSLRNRGILKPGVSVVGPIVGRSAKGVFDRSFLSLAGATLTPGKIVFREALMDDDDIEDLLDLPLAVNMYWDQKQKKVVCDAGLGRIVVDGTQSLDAVRQRSEEARSARLAALEKDGAYAVRTIERLKEHLAPPPMIEDDD